MNAAGLVADLAAMLLLAGLGCSALLPLTINMGRRSSSATRPWWRAG